MGDAAKETLDNDEAVEVVTATLPGAGEEPIVALPKDHFTLSHPTTTIRYRRSTNAARIIEDADKQYILEEADNKNGEHEITIRQLQDSSEGVRFLRATYALVTAFWTGFFFIFCVQVLLFLQSRGRRAIHSVQNAFKWRVKWLVWSESK